MLGLPARSVAATVKYTRDEPGGAMALRTEAQRRRREAARVLRERAAASRAVPQEEPVLAAGTSTVWRSSELPTAQTAQAGVPLSEGITSVFLGAVLYIPVDHRLCELELSGRAGAGLGAVVRAVLAAGGGWPGLRRGP